MSLFVHDKMDLKCLPEGSRTNRRCPWWNGSFNMLAALLRKRELNNSMIFWAVLMTLWRALLTAAEQLAYHTEMKYVSTLSMKQ